jgi:excisionase family DNA binding protein
MNGKNPNSPECQTLDVKSSAVELGVCEETVRRLVRRKVLRKLPGLRRILIPKAEVQRYLAAEGTFR